MIGLKIADRYELEGILGSGGRGVVYRGRDAVLDRQVAVKLLHAELDDEQAELRFRQEARTAARLEHPSIVPIYDFGRSQHGAYLVMRRVHGDDLQHFIETGELTPEDVVEIGAQAAEALVYSHAQGVIHRDIKPGNLMAERLDGSWQVRLLDFGIAVDADADRLTDDADVLGTPLYLSPEQLLEEPLDARSDLYALGVVLYECLTGRPPITGRLHRLIQRILTQQPEPPSHLGAAIDPRLEQLVLSCLAKRPADRPDSARQLRDRLRNLASQPSTGVLVRPGPTTLGRRRAAIVGRGEELRLVSESLQSTVRHGRAQLLLIGGDNGIGKSTLLREIESLASASRIRCVRGHFVERRESSFPYHGFCEAIQDFFSGDHRRARRPRLETVASDLLRLFPMLEDLPIFDGAAPVDLEAEPMPRGQIFEILARTFARLAGERPLVLLLEDLHQADVSVEALQYLFRRLAARSVLIVGAFETPLSAAHPLESLIEWSAAEPEVRRLQLGPLTREDVSRLLMQHLGEAEIDGDALDVLFDTSGGHPLFLGQLVRSWLDSGALAQDAQGRWCLRGDPRSRDRVPDSMRTVLEQRLAGLGPGERALIDALAIVGLRISRSELEALVGALDSVSAHSLRELVARGFLMQSATGLSFSNGLLREIAYHALEEARRQELHRAFARVLENENAGRLERVSFRLAHHWSEGDEVERAATHLLSAARQALFGRSPEDAARLAERILALCERGLPVGCELRGQALAVLARAHIDASRQTQAFRLVQQEVDRGAVSAELYRLGAEAGWATGQLEATARLVEAGLATGDGSHREALLDLHAKLGDLIGQEPGVEAGDAAMPVAGQATGAKRSHADAPARGSAGPTVRGQAARSFDRLGEALLVQGEYLSAREAFETAHARRLEDGETTEDAVDHLARLAELALKLGNYGEALDACRQGLELASDPMQKAHHEALAGRICCATGDFEEASRRVARGFDHLADAPRRDRSMRPEIEALLQRTRGNIWVGLGDPAKALLHYRQALELLPGDSSPWERSIALFNLGEALMHLRRDGEALEQLEEAFLEKTAIGDRWGLAYVHHARARILRRRGDLAAAEREATIGGQIATRIGDPKIEAMLHIELGRILADTGRQKGAEKRFYQALSRAESAAARPEVREARRALEVLKKRPARDVS